MKIDETKISVSKYVHKRLVDYAEENGLLLYRLVDKLLLEGLEKIDVSQLKINSATSTQENCNDRITKTSEREDGE